ncbi:unnamed protein product, partial [marine sediment metagenome]
MTKEISIIDLVKIIRSKNAGPFELTFDIIFKDKETYEKVKKTKVITKELIAKLYHVPIEKVLYFVEFDPANAIKATIVRPVDSGSIGETDVYGAQQHAVNINVRSFLVASLLTIPTPAPNLWGPASVEPASAAITWGFFSKP